MGTELDYTSEFKAPAKNGTTASVDVASARSVQEVQAMVVMAKRFPRDETLSMSKILVACNRRKLAESSMYAYPRGGSTVTGPSIRLAEVLAQNWGNLDFGIIELEQSGGESQVMAYCWDLETNCRQAKVFTVRHERHTKTGSYKLTDPRDIYELVANQGARRLRACILGVIPGDVVDAAVERCDKTLAGDGGKRLVDRVRQMTAAFDECGVGIKQIETRLGHGIDSITETELVQLRKIYTSIRDNMQPVSAYFDVKPSGKSHGDDLPADRRKVNPTLDTIVAETGEEITTTTYDCLDDLMTNAEYDSEQVAELCKQVGAVGVECMTEDQGRRAIEILRGKA